MCHFSYPERNPNYRTPPFNPQELPPVVLLKKNDSDEEEQLNNDPEDDIFRNNLKMEDLFEVLTVPLLPSSSVSPLNITDRVWACATTR